MMEDKYWKYMYECGKDFTSGMARDEAATNCGTPQASAEFSFTRYGLLYAYMFAYMCEACRKPHKMWNTIENLRS